MAPLTPDNYRAGAGPLLGRATSCSTSRSRWRAWSCCGSRPSRGALYLDTGIEPWPGGYTDPRLSPAERSNQAFREQALALRRSHRPGPPTAVICQGANPGLVSQLVKAAGARPRPGSSAEPCEPPVAAEDWARLFRDLGIRTIQIAEHDSQVSRTPQAAGEFVGTWSVDGFLGEGAQPAELGWGTGEGALPADGRRHAGEAPGIYLLQPGIDVRVRSWSPAAGPFVGYLITHMESLSIADHLTLREADRIVYRPTVHYAYCPCPDFVLSLHELLARGFEPQPRQRILAGDIVHGQDELGVLLAGHPRGAYWFGSQLTIDEARRDRAARQRHGAAGRGRHPGRHGGGDRRSRRWGWSSRRSSTSPRAGGGAALSRPGARRLVGLDAAHRPRPAVPRDARSAPTPGGSPMSGWREGRAASGRRAGPSRPEAYRYCVIDCPYLYRRPTPRTGAWACSRPGRSRSGR